MSRGACPYDDEDLSICVDMVYCRNRCHHLLSTMLDSISARSSQTNRSLLPILWKKDRANQSIGRMLCQGTVLKYKKSCILITTTSATA
mmetsp:Transcript_8730/g.13955  ORF Transcript_8730/g.13955 Transcript_8730/m.13955 type:complete len:89 (+) Transcript_8730:118-384(+)